MKLSTFFLPALFAREHYDGDKVFRVKLNNKTVLSTYEKLVTDFDTWKEPRFFGDYGDVHIPQQYVDLFEQKLISNRIDYEVMIEDVEELVAQTYAGAAPEYTTFADFNYEKYHRFDDYQKWQTDFVAANSDIVSLETYGSSFEGRPMNAMKIGKGSRGVIMHGGTHAREWITPITMINTAVKLVEEYRKGSADAKYLNDITWYITINMNPDGYEWTWDSSRMWRKTRNTGTPSACVGVDPNRNWDNCWACVGSSSQPCSDTYHGPSALSEIEMSSTAEYMKNLAQNNNIVGYADNHAYSQYWMFPYGYQRAHTPSHNMLNTISKDITDAIFSVHRSRFVYGTIYEVIYPASGSSADWAYDVPNIPCSFAPELRDRGQYGFLLPENQITPTAEEMWEGYKAWGDHVIAGDCDSK